MSKTLEEVRAAKAKLLDLMEGIDPNAAVGITRGRDSFGLKVNLSGDELVGQIPDEIDGVAVRCEVVGKIRKRQPGQTER